MNKRIWVVLTMILCLCGNGAFAQNNAKKPAKNTATKTAAQRRPNTATKTPVPSTGLKAQADSLKREIAKRDHQIDSLEHVKKALSPKIPELEKRLEKAAKKLKEVESAKPVRSYERLEFVRGELNLEEAKKKAAIQARADEEILRKCGSGEMNEAAKRVAGRIQAKANAEKKRVENEIQRKRDLEDDKWHAKNDAADERYNARWNAANAAKNNADKKLYTVRGTIVEAERKIERLSKQKSDLQRESQIFPFKKSMLAKDKAYTIYDKGWMTREQKFKKSYAIFNENYQSYDMLVTTVTLKNGSKVYVYLIPPKYVNVPVEKLSGITKNHILPIKDGNNWLAIRPNYLFKGQKYHAVYSVQALTEGRVFEWTRRKATAHEADLEVLRKINSIYFPVYEYKGNYYVRCCRSMMGFCYAPGYIDKYNNRGEFVETIEGIEIVQEIISKGRLVQDALREPDSWWW